MSILRSPISIFIYTDRAVLALSGSYAYAIMMKAVACGRIKDLRIRLCMRADDQ